MKKIMTGLMAFILVMGIGAVGVYAAAPEKDDNTNSTSNGTNNGRGTFEEMLPYAKEMHPDLTEQEIKDMYNNCHANNGRGNNNGKGNANGMGNRSMMNNYESRESMMNF
jgi:hypothetical protein